MVCLACRKEHDPLLRCEVAARLAAAASVESPVVSNAAASNGASNRRELPAEVSGAEKKQRWDREKYNEYQRELMRKRRAAARAGFSGGAA